LHFVRAEIGLEYRNHGEHAATEPVRQPVA
jgi:hypothetical protein